MNITVAEAQRREYHELADNEVVQAGDLIEWTEGALSDILPGSPFVGKLAGLLPMSFARGKVFRRVEQV